MRFRQPKFSNPLKRRYVSASSTQQGEGGKCSPDDAFRDKGNAPHAFNLSYEARQNESYRVALWTGSGLQLTMMSIPAGMDTGIEMHEATDQFLYIEKGRGEVIMGKTKGNMNYRRPLGAGYAVLIPGETYHNVINTGNEPLKLYSVYTPKVHPFGTVDKTRSDSEMRESNSSPKKG